MWHHGLNALSTFQSEISGAPRKMLWISIAKSKILAQVAENEPISSRLSSFFTCPVNNPG